MTIELHLPVFETLRIDACCRAAGLDFAAILARYANIITGARQPAEEDPAVLSALGLPATPATQPELALGYEPTPTPAGAHGILARAAKLSQNTTPQA